MSFSRPRIRLVRLIGCIGLAGILIFLPFVLLPLIKGEVALSGPMGRMALLSLFGFMVSFWLGYECQIHSPRPKLRLEPLSRSSLAPREECYGLRGPRPEQRL